MSSYGQRWIRHCSTLSAAWGPTHQWGRGGTLEDEQIVKNTIKALSPRIVAVHGPTGTGKFTVFPLAITHWTDNAKGFLTICAQPRRILAQQLCERVKSNRKMHYHDRTVGYVIARESSRDSSTKLLYCTEARRILSPLTHHYHRT